MRKYALAALLILAFAAVAWPAGAPAKPAGDNAFLGRWDVTVPPAAGSQRARFCWLEVTKPGGTLKGRFNSGGGAVFDLPEVSIANGELTFGYSQGKPPKENKSLWKATLKGGRLEGTAMLDKLTLSWTGARGPVWPKTAPKRKPGKPVDLFNGKDVSGWLGQRANQPLGWSIQDGAMVNQDKGANNIYSEQKFKDFKLEVEFKVDPKSNSGIYLRGRYEIQVMDEYGKPVDQLNVHSMGALYGFMIPPVNACKPPTEWQNYEITLIANRVTVLLNGQKIMENLEVPGITGGALDANESEPGPIMIQGDHGKVQYRKIRVTPLI